MEAFDHLEWTYDGAFEQLFGLGKKRFEQKFSKNSNARGVARVGMLKLRFDWYIISDIGEFSYPIDCHGVCSNNNVVSFVTKLLVESVFSKKMQFFMCLVVSSSRLLFSFHVFSVKWVLISNLI